MADLSALRFLVERRQNTIVGDKTVEGPWELVAAFIDKTGAENFAALKQLHATHAQVEYRVTV